jgi:hypothetical protein
MTALKPTSTRIQRWLEACDDRARPFYLSHVKDVFIYMILVSIFMLWLRIVVRMKQIIHLTYFNAELHKI